MSCMTALHDDQELSAYRGDEERQEGGGSGQDGLSCQTGLMEKAELTHIAAFPSSLNILCIDLFPFLSIVCCRSLNKGVLHCPKPFRRVQDT